ncbi:MAG: hypothetical protein LAP40_28655 [Acidobacteriia bacterium]|nr:hypothetical protein [Terriglobia bacterium]
MRCFAGLLVVCAGASLLFAQSDPADSEIQQARVRLEQLRSLVEAGAAPRAQLAQAEAKIADAEDAALLRRTLYGQDLTDAQSEEMIAAANRRLDRRQQAFDRAKKLVDAGVATQASLSDFLEEIDRARQESDLASQRAGLVHELTMMAELERSVEEPIGSAPPAAREIGERHDGDGVFTPSTFARVESAYESHFGRPLPVSAMGETAVHRALGFDHRGRVDVAIHPDQPEGVWLREYLDDNHIPYFAFRQAVAGKATGAHIHLGPVSGPLAHGG